MPWATGTPLPYHVSCDLHLFERQKPTSERPKRSWCVRLVRAQLQDTRLQPIQRPRRRATDVSSVGCGRFWLGTFGHSDNIDERSPPGGGLACSATGEDLGYTLGLSSFAPMKQLWVLS
jgi:hypothetical protein